MLAGNLELKPKVAHIFSDKPIGALRFPLRLIHNASCQKVSSFQATLTFTAPITQSPNYLDGLGSHSDDLTFALQICLRTSIRIYWRCVLCSLENAVLLCP